MHIRTLVPWGGMEFNYSPGDVVTVSEHVGLARIAAGLAERVEGGDETAGDAAEAERLLAGKAAEAAERIAAVEDAVLLVQALEGERRKSRPRSGVVKALEARIEELQAAASAGPEPPDAGGDGEAAGEPGAPAEGGPGPGPDEA